jgi:hypothetical protein
MWMPESFSQSIPMKNSYFLSFSLAFTKLGNHSLIKNEYWMKELKERLWCNLGQHLYTPIKGKCF